MWKVLCEKEIFINQGTFGEKKTKRKKMKIQKTKREFHIVMSGQFSTLFWYQNSIQKQEYAFLSAIATFLTNANLPRCCLAESSFDISQAKRPVRAPLVSKENSPKKLNKIYFGQQISGIEISDKIFVKQTSEAKHSVVRDF